MSRDEICRRLDELERKEQLSEKEKREAGQLHAMLEEFSYSYN